MEVKTLVFWSELVHELLRELGQVFISLRPSFSASKIGDWDPWMAQRFGSCLWPRARSWGPWIESHVALLARSLLLPPPMSLPLSFSVYRK